MARHKKTKKKTDWTRVLIPTVLFVAVVAVFGQVRQFDFITYDDGIYVTENATVQAGLTWHGLRWAFGVHHSNWHPLTWLSLMLDASIGGLEPRVFHVSNLVCHVANTLLLYLVLSRMTGDRWRAGFVALFFGIHPLHVESVAWVAERKDVLSTVFWLLTMLAYVAYVRRPSWPRYGLVAASLALGLMAKPMLVTLPLVLLLLDLWPLGRVRNGASPWRLVAEKLPLLALVATSSIVTLAAQRTGGAVTDLAQLSLGLRIQNAMLSYVTYAAQTFWPVDLSFFYPYAEGSLATWKTASSALVVAVVTALTVGRARAQPYLICGWLWYLGTLVPVIGLVQVGIQARADRYTYVPLIGLFVVAVWGAADLARWISRRWLVAGGCAISLALGLAAHRQTSYWRDTESLTKHALTVSSQNVVAHANLALALLQRGDADGAIEHSRQALLLEPGRVRSRVTLANALAKKGLADEAALAYAEAIRLSPGDASLHSNLGTILADQGDLEEAARRFAEALRLAPDSVDAHNNMGVLLARLGKYDEAIRLFTRALQLSPHDEELQHNLELARSLRDRAAP